MRGTQHRHIVCYLKLRITPARAGNTFSSMAACYRCKDHPRPCGEHCHLSSSTFLKRGSPPPVRGTQHLRTEDGTVPRITPARAGNTCKSRRRPGREEDHPRPCGEHGVTWQADWPDDGSPPPVRGTRQIRRHRFGDVGITPARAGNTRCRSTRSRQAEDHPRPCGEHIIWILGILRF